MRKEEKERKEKKSGDGRYVEKRRDEIEEQERQEK